MTAGSMSDAIDAMCRECVLRNRGDDEGWELYVKGCPDEQCPLWGVRLCWEHPDPKDFRGRFWRPEVDPKYLVRVTLSIIDDLRMENGTLLEIAARYDVPIPYMRKIYRKVISERKTDVANYPRRHEALLEGAKGGEPP